MGVFAKSLSHDIFYFYMRTSSLNIDGDHPSCLGLEALTKSGLLFQSYTISLSYRLIVMAIKHCLLFFLPWVQDRILSV